VIHDGEYCHELHSEFTARSCPPSSLGPSSVFGSVLALANDEQEYDLSCHLKPTHRLQVFISVLNIPGVGAEVEVEAGKKDVTHCKKRMDRVAGRSVAVRRALKVSRRPIFSTTSESM